MVGLIGAGSMGAGVASVLLRHDLDVVTCLQGRSDASRTRAAAIGLRDVPCAALAHCVVVLSIVPPAAAIEVAATLVRAGVFANGGPLFVDCNAVAPDTVLRIDAMVRDAGGRCVDAGIVGAPPRSDGTVPTVMYASGSQAPALNLLGQSGLEVRILDAPIGAASALKMCFAAISKGLTALVTQVALQASVAQVAAPLRVQLASSLGPTLAWAGRQAPLLADKSYRWIAEMEEIARFLRDIPGAAKMFEGAAEYYAWLDREKDAPTGPHKSLAGFFAGI
jgi:putative dehydrogenase